MKRLLFISFVLNVFFSSVFAENNTFDLIRVEDFESSFPCQFPSEWKCYVNRAKEIYLVQTEEGNRYLKAVALNDSANIGKKIEWDLSAYPYLNWKWRVHRIPRGSDETKKEKNDSAASVYLLLDNGFSMLPKYIKYIWSSQIKPETRFWVKKNKAVVVLRSGNNELKNWHSESVNLLEDYRYFYGEKNPKVLGISILSDSDATESEAEADYDDIILSHKPLHLKNSGDGRYESKQNQNGFIEK